MIENAINLFGQNEINKFINILRSLILVDIGTIARYERSTNKAQVTLSKLDQTDNPITIDNVEVLLFGSTANGFRHDFAGSLCIVLMPRTVMPSGRDRKVLNRTQEYSQQGAKCIPFGVMTDSELSIGFDGFGDFSISSKAYCLSITKDGLSYVNKDGSVKYSLSGSEDMDTTQGGGKIRTVIGNDGRYEMYFMNNDGKCSYRLLFTPDGTYQVQRVAYKTWTNEEYADRDTYTDYAWTYVQNPDGSLQLKQIKDNGDILNQIDFSASGDVTISQTKAENTITLNQDGTCSLVCKGDLSIESKANINITSAQKITMGNSGATLKSILVDDLLDTLLNNFDTVGSPGSHSTGPGAKANITAFKQAWAQLLG